MDDTITFEEEEKKKNTRFCITFNMKNRMLKMDGHEMVVPYDADFEVARFASRDADDPEVRIRISMYGKPGNAKHVELIWKGDDPKDEARAFSRRLETWLNLVKVD